MKMNLDNIKNPQLRSYLRERTSFMDIQENDVATLPQNRLVEVTSGKIIIGTDDDANIVGATMEGSIAKDKKGNVAFGAVEVLSSGKITALDKVAGAANGRVRKHISAQSDMLAATAGGNYANQPSGEKVRVVSDNVGDDGSVTLYFTRTGALTTVATETVTVNGTTLVETDADNIEVVLAIVTDDTHDGTLTISGASTGTITTIATGTASTGFHAATATEAYGAIPTVKASDTSTKKAAVIGTDVDGAALSVVVSLNNTTDVNLGTAPFNTVTTVLIGDVESSRNATVETKDADTNDIGFALQSGATKEVVKIWMQPYGI